MLRTLLIAGIIGLAGIQPSFADEPHKPKSYDLHLTTFGGNSDCGPISFARETKPTEPLPHDLVNGVLYNSTCRTGIDIPLVGNIDKSFVVLYQAATDESGFQFMWMFQWPLQDNGYWKKYVCKYGEICLPDGDGSYSLGLGDARRGEK